MGHRNETCFASNLPINGEVVAIPVIQKASKQWFRVPTTLYLPVGPPVRGTYDAYGGIDFSEEERALLEPLRQEILKTLPDVDYASKQRLSGTLRGIGVAEANRELHLGEPLSEHEQLSQSAEATRTSVNCGDSAWLKFPTHNQGLLRPVEDWTYYPVSWACMRPEVYDHLVSFPYDTWDKTEAEFEASVYEYFEWVSRRHEPTPKPEDEEAMLEELRFHQSMLEHDVHLWIREVSDVGLYRYCALQSYLDQPISKATQRRFFEMMKLFSEMFMHRIVLHRSYGCQDGDYRRHRNFHRLCEDVAQKAMYEYEYEEE